MISEGPFGYARTPAPGLYLGRIRRGGRVTTSSGPIRVEELAPRFVDPLVRVSAKVVALRLQDIGGKSLAAIAIVVRQGTAERGNGDPI